MNYSMSLRQEGAGTRSLVSQKVWTMTLLEKGVRGKEGRRRRRRKGKTSF
jgi:hypothetical protein